MTEYKQLEGKGANTGVSGDHVIANQGAAEGFSRVSQIWLPKTLTFDQCLEKLEKERSNKKDIKAKWKDWVFEVADGKIVMRYQEQSFVPTEYAIKQACGYSAMIPSFVEKTLSKDFKADEQDLQQLVAMMNYRKQRFHSKDGEDKELLFRTYGDGTLRAVLSLQYAIIDNIWFMGLLKDLVKDGRVSHMRGNLDTIHANILIPDSIRAETDSDYGGLFAVRNSEIGQGSVDTRPSLFRAICMNGCIHQGVDGVAFRQVHKGKIELKDLAKQIKDNLDNQIKIIPSVIDEFLKTREFEFAPELTLGVFAAVAERFKLTAKEGNDIVNQFVNHEVDHNSAFGVINSITRAGQLYDAQTTEDFDKIGGVLVNENWDKFIAKAKDYTVAEIGQILNLSV